MPRFQERFRQIAFARESESSEALTISHVAHPDRTPASRAIRRNRRSKSGLPENARWSMIGPGGGFLIFGIRVLFVECDPLQLVREAADFAFVFGVLQALQADMKGLFGSTEAGVGRRRSRASPELPFPLLGSCAETGFLAFSLRFSGVSRAARAGPPFLPPLPAKPIAAGLLCFAAIRPLCARAHRDTAVRSDREECPGLSVRKSAHPCGTGAEVRAVPTPCLASKAVR